MGVLKLAPEVERLRCGHFAGFGKAGNSYFLSAGAPGGDIITDDHQQQSMGETEMKSPVTYA